MDKDTHRRGIRPLLHEPNRLWPWVFRQHQVWVDVNGSEHEIESMPLDYVENVIRFCRRRAVWIYVLIETEEDNSNTEATDEINETAQRDDGTIPIDFVSWLEGTPLMRALRRRLRR
jgi:hypothetical protein